MSSVMSELISVIRNRRGREEEGRGGKRREEIGGRDEAGESKGGRLMRKEEEEEVEKDKWRGRIHRRKTKSSKEGVRRLYES